MRTTLALVASGISLASAASHPSSFRHERRAPISKRFTTLTEQYATQTLSSDYLLSNNLWGMYSGSGRQTTQANAVSGDKVDWSTSWSWSGVANEVKSYANIGLTTGLGHPLSAVSSIPVTWSWSYNAGGASSVSGVSYDLWLSTDPSCGNAVSCSTYEIMVWLDGRGGCTPAGSKQGIVTVQGKTWELWTGTVQNWGIFSFVATSSITDYDADLNDFFTFLIKEKGLSASQYITAVQGGTEPFTGSSVTLTSTDFSMKVLTGGKVVSTTSSKPVASSTSTKAPVTTSRVPVTTSKAVPTTSKAPSASASASSPSTGGACGSAYSQCGGKSFSGSTCCPSGFSCKLQNEYYSQCLPSSAAASALPSKVAVTSAGNTLIVSSSSPSISRNTYTPTTPGSSPVPSTTATATAPAFTGALGSIPAPSIAVGGRGFTVEGVEGVSFHSFEEARERSCAVQKNECANESNKAKNGEAAFTVGECDAQLKACMPASA